MTHLTPGQTAVLKALAEFPKGIIDVGLADYVHHVADQTMSSSGVRTRRAELDRMGLVKVVGIKTMPSGRNAAVHALSDNGKKLVRNLNRRTQVAATA